MDHSARESMKSAAKRDNYCELQDILSSNNLNANGGFGYSWNHVRLRVDIKYITINRYRVIMPVEYMGPVYLYTTSSTNTYELELKCVFVSLFSHNINFDSRPQTSGTAR